MRLFSAEPIEFESNYTCASDGGRWDDERHDGWAWRSGGTAGSDAAFGPVGWLPRGRELRRDRALLARPSRLDGCRGHPYARQPRLEAGMAEWRRAGDVDELVSVFGSGVPVGTSPIPPTE